MHTRRAPPRARCKARQPSMPPAYRVCKRCLPDQHRASVITKCLCLSLHPRWQRLPFPQARSSRNAAATRRLDRLLNRGNDLPSAPLKAQLSHCLINKLLLRPKQRVRLNPLDHAQQSARRPLDAGDRRWSDGPRRRDRQTRWRTALTVWTPVASLRLRELLLAASHFPLGRFRRSVPLSGMHSSPWRSRIPCRCTSPATICGEISTLGALSAPVAVGRGRVPKQTSDRRRHRTRSPGSSSRAGRVLQQNQSVARRCLLRNKRDPRSGHLSRTSTSKGLSFGIEAAR